jgi:hypothetical protein
LWLLNIVAPQVVVSEVQFEQAMQQARIVNTA